jgi:hypothetical protein
MSSKALKWMFVSLSLLPAFALGQPNIYPAQPSGRLYLDLDRGTFAFAPQSEADALTYEWVNTVTSKDASRPIRVIAVVAGKVGIANENGDGLICHGEEKSSPYAKPSMTEHGKFSINKVRAEALKRAMDECQAEGGSIVLEHGEIAVVHAHSQSSPLPHHPGKCFSSEVQVKCDLSVHAAEISELYKKFRAEFPAHSIANDEAFDALR